jgi:tetratricopeptide (TPR) repeat protein
MATKQNYVAFPLVMIAADLVLFPGGWRLRRRWLVLPALGLALGLAASLGLREAAAGLGPRYEVGNLGPDLSRSDYQRTQIDVLVTYLRLFALPTGQNLDYDYPVAKSWAEPALLAKLALLVALAAVGVGLSASNRTRDPGWRLVGLGIVWFFAMHAVESSGVEVLDLIFEHRMYLPSVGLVLAVVVGAAAGLPERLTRPAAAALAAAALVLGAATYARNEVWRSESRLWKDVLAKSPKKVRPLLAMGERMLELRRVGEAERYFERAYQLDPGHATVLVQLGAIAQMKGDAARAEDLFRRVLEIEPNHWIALANLGDLALARGDREEALRYFAHAAEHEQLSTLARARLERLRRSEASPTPAPAPSRSPATP